MMCLPEEGAEPLMSLPREPGAGVGIGPADTDRKKETTEKAPVTPIASDKAPATSATDLAAVGDNATTNSMKILHAEEIFRDVPANTVTKKQAFNKYNTALRQERQAEAHVASAKTPKAKTQAEKALVKAKERVAATKRALEEFVIRPRMGEDQGLKALAEKLQQAKKNKDAAKVAEFEMTIKAYKDELYAALLADADGTRHTDPGHTDEGVFDPVKTDVTTHDFVFPDGQHVRVRDHVVAYAATVPFGVDSQGPANHDEVQTVMKNAGLSSSKLKILQAISGFEGGFDTVNTYDRAKVTWGFVQWTGGSHSDLTQALTVIKEAYPAAFAKNFQAYGIDVVKDELVITMPDGTPPVVGKDAADAIMKNPKLAAALAHAGRDEDVKKGEVQAAVHIEIDSALAMSVTFEGHKFKASQLITSEYGVGLLANTYVHSGKGAAGKRIQGAIDGYLAKHPYKADDAEWMAGAEEATIAAMASHDRDRARRLQKILHNARGSFQP